MKKKMFVLTLFLLATFTWTMAQQPGAAPQQSGGQAAAQDPTMNLPVTEGCLGGSNPNFTITDQAGKTYKLNIPPNADTSKLAQHVGESVQVAGSVSDTGNAGASAINVRGIGRGTGKCPAASSGGAQSQPKQ